MATKPTPPVKSIKTFLGERPETFPPVDVEFKAPSGEVLTIPQVAFTYRTRKEFAEWADAREQAAMQGVKQLGDDLSNVTLFDQADRHTTQTVLECVSSWGLDVPLDAECVAELINDAPAAFGALYARYTAAARDGRLGN